MSATIAWTRNVRNILFNLDLSSKFHHKIYEDYLYDFLTLNEGVRKRVYKDTQGYKTIGIGFNMDHAGAKEEWIQALGHDISFSASYVGDRELNKDNVHKLFLYASRKRRDELLKHHYAAIWHNLRPNEMLAIEDAYFNAPALVKSGTRFHSHICDYVGRKDPSFLKAAVDEIRYRSNRTQHPGIQHRREVEAEMLYPALHPV